ncbi:PaaI family thioesterase [Planctomycetota bacterium]|nr:PaaI family thioesterase [Planctomycetota bacterium]
MPTCSPSSSHPTQQNTLRDQLHDQCVICSQANPHSLRMRCTLNPDGSVTGNFSPKPHLKGYSNQLHGGILTALLDSAMAQCLLLNNIHAVTATLDVRFRHPAPLTGTYSVTAQCDEHRRTIHRMSAKIIAEGITIVTAKSQFVDVAEK